MTCCLHQRHITLSGFEVTHDPQLGWLMVSHDGSLTWDQLQAIKNDVWGKAARAIEIYPADGDVVNSGNYRHLWRLGADDFCPDLLGHAPTAHFLEQGETDLDSPLEERHRRAWLEAEQLTR